MTIYIIAIGILGLLVIVLAYFMLILNKRLTILLRGKNAKTLEDSIHSILNELEIIKRTLVHQDTIQKQHDERISNTIKTIPTIRFNPFSDSGGNQSFASAFLTEQGNGVVISSLYSREKTSVFAKPIKNFQSSFELTEEEQTVLNQTKIK